MRCFFTTSEVSKLMRAYTETDFCGSISELLDYPVPHHPNEKDVVSYLELTRYMRNQLLRDSDVMSMASSLELRVPFVDRSLIESLRHIPSQFRHAHGKQLLLDAVPEIPDWVAHSPKKGFRFPFDRWISSQWSDLFTSIDAWSPVPLEQWYRRWILFTLNHFLRENRIDVAAALP
jgi:asparagine synthase (glutamine-hydrolysing)